MKRLIIILVAIAALCANAQWKELTTGVTSVLYSISAVNDRVAWIAGDAGVVLYTSNGGTTWTQKGAGSVLGTVPLYNIFAIDSTKALVTGSSTRASFLYRTSDAGETWTQVHTQSGGFGDGIWMFDSLRGVYYGDPVGGKWSLWRTSDGGITWDSAGLNIAAPETGEAGWNNSIWGSGDTVAFGSSGTKIYISTDTGWTWKTSATPTEESSYVLSFNDSSSIYVGGDQLIRSTDQSTSWQTLTTPVGAGNVNGIALKGSNIWFTRGGTASVVDPVIYFSADTGNTWTTAYTTPPANATEYYYHLTMSRNGSSIWAVRSGGSAVKFDSIAVAVNDLHTLPEKYSLEQNYPNPFNPSTTIKYSLPNEQHVSIKIYDIMGREVKTLVDEVKPAGNYELQFNASSLASGVYFYKLTTDQFSAIKKMTLIK